MESVEKARLNSIKPPKTEKGDPFSILLPTYIGRKTSRINIKIIPLETDAE